MTLLFIILIFYLYIIKMTTNSLQHKLLIDVNELVYEELEHDFKISTNDNIILFSPSKYVLGKDKPNLTIDTNPSTGNEGLDAEKRWREKSAYCEHEDVSIYEADENDNVDPMLCDYTGDSEETAGQSTAEQSSAPKKHPAVVGEGDWAYICNDCHAVICKDCNVDYPSEDNTPQYSPIPEDFTNKNPFDDKQNPSTKEESSIEEDVSKKQNPLVEKDSSNKPDDSSKSSLIDDFANTDCEMPDYTAGDD